MKDRVSVNPGRVLITPESGNPYYATMTRADNPTQEGTPLNKNTLLKDETAAKIGLGEDATVDDALANLVVRANDYNIEFITVSKNWVAPENLVSDVHVIMGGGGGGSGYSYASQGQTYRAGGGGGYIVEQDVTLTPGATYPAVIGAGGNTSSSGDSGVRGGSTTFAGLTAEGGYGGSNKSPYSGGNGGSGGGSANTGNGGTGTFGGGGGGSTKGGNGGTYGGGGGGAGSSTKATGGTYGGAGSISSSANADNGTVLSPTKWIRMVRSILDLPMTGKGGTTNYGGGGGAGGNGANGIGGGGGYFGDGGAGSTNGLVGGGGGGYCGDGGSGYWDQSSLVWYGGGGGGLFGNGGGVTRIGTNSTYPVAGYCGGGGGSSKGGDGLIILFYKTEEA